MFQPKKNTQQLPNIRLAEKTTNPGFDEIQLALDQAGKAAGRTVELPWRSDTGGKSFVLKVKYDSAAGDPIWTMHSASDNNTALVWTYQTGDLQLVVNLVLTECAGGQLQDFVQQDAYAVSQKTNQSNYPTAAATTTSSAEQTLSDLKLHKSNKATLEGDLTKMQVPNLLQSISLSKMTGRLSIRNAQGTANLYFNEGQPMHAQVGTATGHLGVIELMTWETGEFHFFPEERTTEQTIHKRLETLLMEGAALLDQNKYLEQCGLKAESFLLRKHQSITEQQFENLISKGVAMDMPVQKRFYQSIDNKSKFLDILRRCPLTKTDWIPIVFNLITCDLIVVSNQSAVSSEAAAMPAIDQAGIQSVYRFLIRPETGLYTYPAFLFFLEQEEMRRQQFAWPYATMIMEMAYHIPGAIGPNQPLSSKQIHAVSERLHSIKRKTDVFAHYETFDYALLLPNSDSSSATIVANQLVELIANTALPDAPEKGQLVLCLGVASIPGDCQNLGQLLACAIEAKKKAKEKSMPVVVYSQIKSS